MRMKLEVPYDDLSPIGSLPHSIATQQSPTPHHSTAFFAPLDQTQSIASASPSTEQRPDSGIYTIEDATSQLKRLMGFEDGFDERPVTAQSHYQQSPAREPPIMPSTNPWDVNGMPPLDDIQPMSESAIERRPEVPRGGAESPVDPAISPVVTTKSGSQARQSLEPPPSETLESVTNGSETGLTENDDRYYLPSTGNYPNSPGRDRRYNVFPPSTTRPRTVSQIAAAIPEDSVIDGTGGLSLSTAPVSANNLNESTQSPRALTPGGYAVNNSFSGFDNTQRPSMVSHQTQNSTSETVASSHLSPGTRPVQESEGLQVVPNNHRLDQELPIPVEADNKQERASSSSQPWMPDCTITPQSSFWMAKGFCEGAKEVSRGGIGVRKTKKPVSRSLSTHKRCIQLTQDPGRLYHLGNSGALHQLYV
jgi:hypothetical protein